MICPVRAKEWQFSDLLRRPKDVARDVEDGDVLLRRRGEPDLCLLRADRERDRAEVFAAVARALRNLAVHSPAALTGALEDAFPWMDLLPAKDRRLFADEFSRVVIAAADLDNMAPLTQLLREWRATAEVYADPRLARRLRGPVVATGEPVAIPPY